MKKYEKPQFEKLEISDIITVSNVFEGLAENPGNVKIIDFTSLPESEQW